MVGQVSVEALGRFREMSGVGSTHPQLEASAVRARRPDGFFCKAKNLLLAKGALKEMLPEAPLGSAQTFSEHSGIVPKAV